MNILGVVASSMRGATNSYESIQTVTVGSGGQTTISFTAIPGTYKHLQVRFSALPVSGGGTQRIRCQFNTDTGNNYATHLLYGSGSGVATANATTTNQITVGSILGNTNTPNVGVLDILDYVSTTKNKTTRSLSGVDTNGGGEIDLNSGLWMNTSAITRIDLYYNGVNLAQYSSFALYGIKG